MLGLDACDCAAGEVLFQVVNDARNFADLERGLAEIKLISDGTDLRHFEISLSKSDSFKSCVLGS